MASSSSEQPQLPPPLISEDEDPYKPAGRIQWKIENLAEFVQEPVMSERLSAPIYVRGVPWKIRAVLHEYDSDFLYVGQKPNSLHFYLEYSGIITDPTRYYWATAKLKMLAQKEGSADIDLETGFDGSDNHTYYFHEIDIGWRCLGRMLFEDVMHRDNGWYDEQGDSIVLAMDLTVDADEGIAKYVLVAQNELTLDKVPMSFSMQIGNLQWLFNFDEHATGDNWEEENSLVMTCKDVAKGRANKVLLELVGYHSQQDDHPKSEAYSPFTRESVFRHLFTRADNSLTIKVPVGRNVLFTVRVLKERSLFPDFTMPTAMVGHFPADVQLRVGDQQFHVNKQFLSSISPFFDRMFNGLYPDATKQEVELSLNTHSAELFHDFLLVLCVSDALPNSMNVAALFKMADFYDSDIVRAKCDQHLRMAREMPIEKRVLLARNHGSEQTQDMIMDGVNLEQSKRIINNLFMKNRSL